MIYLIRLLLLLTLWLNLDAANELTKTREDELTKTREELAKLMEKLKFQSIKIGEEEVLVPGAILDQMQYFALKARTAFTRDKYDPIEENEIINAENFKKLLAILQKEGQVGEGVKYNADELAAIVLLADYLLLDNMQPVLNEIKANVSPELAKALGGADLQLSLDVVISVKNDEVSKFSSVGTIAWHPNSKYFLVKEDTGALYRTQGYGAYVGNLQAYYINGMQIGKMVNNVLEVDWSLLGDKQYVVKELDKHDTNKIKAQMYNISGEPIWSSARDIDAVNFNDLNLYDYARYDLTSPNGEYQFLYQPFESQPAQLIDKAGLRIGQKIKSFQTVIWSPDSQHYFVRLDNESAQLYDLYNINGWPLDQQILVQYVINQFNNDKIINAKDKSLELLDKDIIDLLVNNGFLSSSYFW